MHSWLGLPPLSCGKMIISYGHVIVKGNYLIISKYFQNAPGEEKSGLLGQTA